jgi:hypothetical protein
MRRRTLILVVFVGVSVGAVGLLLFQKPRVLGEKSMALAVTPTSNKVLGSKSAWQNGHQQMPAADPARYDPLLPQWKEYWRRTADDKKWEWKVPIEFYGRIIDQFGDPVGAARVHVSWTDLSDQGTTERELFSDENGSFLINGVMGKRLTVNLIQKEGYESAARNFRSFEYAAFFDQNYHVPDPKRPVIFEMHRKAETEPLIVVSNKYRIPEDGVVGVDLKTGRLGGTDLLIELIANSDPTGKIWIAKVSAPSGGIQLASDEFATVAPETGYESVLTINQDSPQPAGFQGGSLYKGGRFYVKIPLGYAVAEFRMIPGNKSLHFTSYLNPKPSSRNLEFDLNKAMKLP